MDGDVIYRCFSGHSHSVIKFCQYVFMMYVVVYNAFIQQKAELTDILIIVKIILALEALAPISYIILWIIGSCLFHPFVGKPLTMIDGRINNQSGMGQEVS